MSRKARCICPVFYKEDFNCLKFKKNTIIMPNGMPFECYAIFDAEGKPSIKPKYFYTHQETFVMIDNEKHFLERGIKTSVPTPVDSWSYKLFTSLKSATDDANARIAIRKANWETEKTMALNIDSDMTEYEFAKELWEKHDVICFPSKERHSVKLCLKVSFYNKDDYILKDNSGKARWEMKKHNMIYYGIKLGSVRLNARYTHENLNKCVMLAESKKHPVINLR